jgi:hypothetical protein
MPTSSICLYRIDTFPHIDDTKTLLHIGLAYNQISTFLAFGLPQSLVSLDLSWNNIVNLTESVEALKSIPTLKFLILIGNPIFLHSRYYSEIILGLPKLSYLDDIPVHDVANHKPQVARNNVLLHIKSISLHKVPANEDKVNITPEKPNDE